MKKVSKTKIAATYATALYDAAFEKNVLDKVLEDVRKLIEVCRKDDEFVRYLANPVLDESDKKDVLAKTAKVLKLDEDTLRCLDIISENRRFGELAQILEEFVHIYYRRHNIAEAEVESVKKLSAAQVKKLTGNLEKFLGRKVVVSYKITPELIGGLRIISGSQMIDDSVESKLNRLEIMMKGGQ